MTPLNQLNQKISRQICEDYYETVNSNIELFLKDKQNKISMHLENIEEDFKEFWNSIPAKGDLDMALAELSRKHNKNVWSMYPTIATEE